MSGRHQETWQESPERIDRALQSLTQVRSRTQAQHLIAEGRVQIDGTLVVKAGTKVQPGQKITVSDIDHYVSRGAHKLTEALNVFSIDVHNRIALDIGASTGGFTQVLLERGAEAVVAVDVGHDQLAQTLRDDKRVLLFEGCNARYMTHEELVGHTGEVRRPSLIVGDLSFISLTQIIPAATEVMAQHADLIFLIKPQFEVGREVIGDGVITDLKLQEGAIRRVLSSAKECGLTLSGIIRSPILGGRGNREFLAHFTSKACDDGSEWDEMIAQVVYEEGNEHD